ncbi:hypothetical protein JEQ12_007760 [Ovis aries]|uniref:Liprin-alpha CC2 domain-containing protein n=1 Tax=Ovis aries TaxID=9940 RepID=A0A836CT82_SHEEP|nr:hypothetical protein JEQ12_007760 [Ovis aries]
MGRRRARLWALFQCCIPKAKAKTRKNLASAQVLEAERPEELATSTEELNICREQLLAREEEIALLNAEQNNIMLLVEHLECRVSRYIPSLETTAGKWQAQSPDGMTNELEVLQALKSLFEHHKALDKKRTRDEDLAQVIELQDIIEKKSREQREMRDRLAALSAHVTELEKDLDTARKDLLKSKEANVKLQQDVREAMAQKEDMEKRITTLEKRYLAAQRKATSVHNLHDKLENEIANKDSMHRQKEDKDRQLQECLELAEQKLQQMLTEVVAELTPRVAVLSEAKQREKMNEEHNEHSSDTVDKLLSVSDERLQLHLKERMAALEDKVQPLKDQDRELKQQASMLANVGQLFKSDKGVSDGEGDRDTLFSMPALLSPSGPAVAKTLAMRIQEQLDKINEEIWFIQKDKENTDQRAEGIESRVGSGSFSNLRRFESSSSLNLDPASSHAGSFPPSRGRSMPERRQPSPEPEEDKGGFMTLKKISFKVTRNLVSLHFFACIYQPSDLRKHCRKDSGSRAPVQAAQCPGALLLGTAEQRHHPGVGALGVPLARSVACFALLLPAIQEEVEDDTIKCETSTSTSLRSFRLDRLTGSLRTASDEDIRDAHNATGSQDGPRGNPSNSNSSQKAPKKKGIKSSIGRWFGKKEKSRPGHTSKEALGPDHYRLFHGPCNPELSPEMSQAPGSLLPAPARDQSLFRGHWAQAAYGELATSTEEELNVCREQLVAREEEIALLNAERNNTRLLLEHMEFLVSRYTPSLQTTVGKWQAQSPDGMTSELEVLKSLKILFEHHKALDKKRTRDEDLAQVIELKEIIKKKSREQREMKDRLAALSAHVTELEKDLDTARKDLLKSKEVKVKLQQDIHEKRSLVNRVARQTLRQMGAIVANVTFEAMAQKEDMEKRITTLEKRYLAAQRKAISVHNLHDKLENEIANKDSMHRQKEDKDRQLQECLELAEQKLQQMLTEVVAELAQPVAALSKVQPLKDQDRERRQQASVLANVGQLFKSDKGVSDGEGDRDTLFSMPRSQADAKTPAGRIQKQLDRINEESWLIQKDKEKTDQWAEGIESRVGSGSFSNLRRFNSSSSLNLDPASSHAGSFPPSRGRSMPERRQPSPEPEEDKLGFMTLKKIRTRAAVLQFRQLSAREPFCWAQQSSTITLGLVPWVCRSPALWPALPSCLLLANFTLTSLPQLPAIQEEVEDDTIKCETSTSASLRSFRVDRLTGSLRTASDEDIRDAHKPPPAELPSATGSQDGPRGNPSNSNSSQKAPKKKGIKSSIGRWFGKKEKSRPGHTSKEALGPDHYRLFHGPCNPELSPEMSQAPGSLLPAPARDQSLFRGHWAQAACGELATSTEEELNVCREQLFAREEEIALLNAERNNTRLLLEHMEFLVSRYTPSLQTTVGKWQAQSPDGMTSELEVLKSLKILFEHHKALDKKRTRDEDLAQVIELKEIIKKKSREQREMKDRLAALSAHVTELEKDLDTARKDLLKSKEVKVKLQQDIREAMAQKEDMEKRITTLEKRYLAAQRKAISVHNLHDKLENEIANKDSMHRQKEDKDRQLQECLELAEQKLQQMLTEVVAELAQPVAALSKVQPLKDQDREREQQASMLANVGQLFKSDKGVSDGEGDRVTLFSMPALLSPRGQADAKTPAGRIQKQLDRINEESWFIQKDKENTDQRAEGIESRVGSGSFSNLRRFESSSSLNLDPASSHAGSFPPSRGRSMPERRQPSPEPEEDKLGFMTLKKIRTRAAVLQFRQLSAREPFCWAQQSSAITLGLVPWVCRSPALWPALPSCLWLANFTLTSLPQLPAIQEEVEDDTIKCETSTSASLRSFRLDRLTGSLRTASDEDIRDARNTTGSQDGPGGNPSNSNSSQDSLQKAPKKKGIKSSIGRWFGKKEKGRPGHTSKEALGPEVLPYCPSVPLSHMFLAFAVPFVEDTLPPSSEEDRNEILSVKCQVTYPFLRGLP